jgi:hypothetical protein
VALLLLVVLQWSEPEASGIRAPAASPIKLVGIPSIENKKNSYLKNE